jgi:hypothetical protein
LAFCLLVSGCGSSFQFEKIQQDGVVQTRPPTTIGPPESIGTGPWIQFEAEVTKEQIDAVRRADSTLHLIITSCSTGGQLDVEDIYVDGKSINISSDNGIDGEEMQKLSSPVLGKFFLEQSLVNRHRGDICAKPAGGNMAGWRVYGKANKLPD